MFHGNNKISNIFHLNDVIEKVMHKDAIVYINYYLYTLSGTLHLTLTKSIGKPLQRYEISGATAQDREPSPENPVPVRGVGNFDAETGKYKIPILLNDNQWKDGDIYATAAFVFQNKEFFLKAGKYKISLECETVKDASVEFYDSEKNRIFVLTVPINGSPIDFELSQDAHYISLWRGISTIESRWIRNIKIYSKEITSTIYTDKPLYSGDKLAYPDGTRTNKTGVLVLDGSQSRLTYSESGGYFRLDQLGSKAWTAGLCSHYSVRSDNTSNDMTIYAKSKGIIWIYDSRFSDLDSYKAYLSEQYNNGTPVTIYYELAEPTVEPIILPEIPTLSGTTILDVQYSEQENLYTTSDGNTYATADGKAYGFYSPPIPKPENVEVKYYGKK